MQVSGTVQVQPVPESVATVRPVGGFSVTVTVPVDAELPAFETLTVYMTVSPGLATVQVCVFVMVRSLISDGSITTPSVSRDPTLV